MTRPAAAPTRASFRISPNFLVAALVIAVLVGSIPIPGNADQDPRHGRFFFIPGGLVVSRITYDGNTFGSPDTFPFIFNDPNVSGVQGSIHLDQYLPFPHSPRLGTLDLPVGSITTSFSSKSEGALTLSPNGLFLAYMGYQGPDGAEGVSNSETPGATLTTNTAPTFNREVAIVDADAAITLQPETNAYSGDNPRAAVSPDGVQIYMAGNSDSTLNKDGSGPGTTIGARLGMVGSDMSIELGVYVAADRPDESKKQHIKDSNFRGIGIFNGNLYVSKGSGGNGDDGIFQVGTGLPTTTGNTITLLLGDQATNPTTGVSSPLTPFGFFFANATTLYVADEGNPNTDASGNLIPDPLAGLQKWVLTNGTWQLAYTIQAGLHLDEAKFVDNYPVPTYTYGIRNMTGQVDRHGIVTIYAITAQFSSISGGEPDPTRLVAVRDRVAATSPETGWGGGDDDDDRLDHFFTLQSAKAGEVFRGVALAPCKFCGKRDDDDSR